MALKIHPPALSGTPAEQLEQLKLWLNIICEKINLNFDSIENKKKEDKK